MSGTVDANFQKRVVGYRRVETRVDDTLQRIAARELGDASRWPDIANLNNLLPPYLTNDLGQVSDRVLFAGSPIMVPSASPQPSGVTDPEAVYGTDLLLQRGQLVDDGAGDLATVSGIPNLVQALGNAVQTHTGELLMHLSYGCDAYRILGKGANPSSMQLAAAFVAKAIRNDPRVSSVSGATASVLGDAVPVKATAVTVDGKRVPVGTSGNLSG